MKETITDVNGDGIADLPGQSVYEAARAPRPPHPAAEFFAPAAEPRLRAAIATVLAAEAPIHPDLLVRRVTSFWEQPRLTPKVTDRVLALVPADARLVRTASREFYWRADQDPARYTAFRVPRGTDDEVREAEHICPQEAANACSALLQEHSSLTPDDLIKAAARTFGLSRVGPRVRQCFEEAVAEFQSRPPPPAP